MNEFNKEELEEALRAIDSTIGKCEKVQPKLKVDYLDEYKRLLQTTNLQKGYQEFVKFFRSLRTYMQKELPEFTFTGSIVENNMDYSYFQFTNDELKKKGLKFVIAFVHGDFVYEIWLSGVNREIQCEHFGQMRDRQHPFTLTNNPNKTDFILKMQLVDDCDYNNAEQLLKTMKENAVDFIHEVKRL